MDNHEGAFVNMADGEAVKTPWRLGCDYIAATKNALVEKKKHGQETRKWQLLRAKGDHDSKRTPRLCREETYHSRG